MTNNMSVLDQREQITSWLSQQSAAIINFDGDYYVLRIANEPATDIELDVDRSVLEYMLLHGMVKRVRHTYGDSYTLIVDTDRNII